MDDPVRQEIAALTDHDWAIREDAAIRLGRLKDPRAIEPLVGALRDPDRSVREAAIEALLAIGSPSTTAVCACLADPDLTVQESASRILASIADAEALDSLVAALNSSDWIVRMYIAKALGRLSDPRAVAPLLELLQDPVKTVREEASAALVAIGRPAVPHLIEALTHPDWMVRLRAIESLKMIRPPEAVPALITLAFHDPDSTIREDAVRALGVSGDERAVEPLITIVTQQPKLRLAAIEALGWIGDRRAVPVLSEVIQKTPTSALPTFADCAPPQDPILLEQIAAIRALGMIDDDTALPILATALTYAPTRQAAAEALARFGRRAVPWLRRALSGATDDSSRQLARQLLASLQSPIDDGRRRTASDASPAMVINRRTGRDSV
ncbi:MAG: HEAT repeat domain-containing protein [Nitrospira sp.]|nr:HEAT repeat domain-containing protein [Nitrospira sp.]MCP9464152.1 HEAT repeat domain-containing protein [Nitrospira sp.]